MRRNRNGLLDLQFKVKWKESGDISWAGHEMGKPQDSFRSGVQEKLKDS
jgi:hypothetical protein